MNEFLKYVAYVFSVLFRTIFFHVVVVFVWLPVFFLSHNLGLSKLGAVILATISGVLSAFVLFKLLTAPSNKKNEKESS
ncbi:MAG: hypothetical protein DRR19_30920 [Candidatus Parabeggiatoa sp. nov. 1]|nr:MAG: hypothetical protein DRR19_30920 [Gammaproteobacteria bacterium]